MLCFETTAEPPTLLKACSVQDRRYSGHGKVGAPIAKENVTRSYAMLNPQLSKKPLEGQASLLFSRRRTWSRGLLLQLD